MSGTARATIDVYGVKPTYNAATYGDNWNVPGETLYVGYTDFSSESTEAYLNMTDAKATFSSGIIGATYTYTDSDDEEQTGSVNGTLTLDSSTLVIKSNLAIGTTGKGTLSATNGSTINISDYLYLTGTNFVDSSVTLEDSTLVIDEDNESYGLYIVTSKYGGLNFSATNCDITVGSITVNISNTTVTSDDTNYPNSSMSTVTFDGTSAIEVTGDVSFSGSYYTATISQPMNVGGDFTVSGNGASTLTVSGDDTAVAIDGALVVNSTSGFSVLDNSTMTAGTLEMGENAQIVVTDTSGSGAVAIGDSVTAVNGAVVVGADIYDEDEDEYIPLMTVDGGFSVIGNLIMYGTMGTEGASVAEYTTTTGYTLKDGATLVVNIDTDASTINSDTLAVTDGDVILEDGSTVYVSVNGSSIMSLFLEDYFDVITAGGTITDNASIKCSSLFFDFNSEIVTSGTDEVYRLNLSQTSGFSGPAVGENEKSTAGALDAMLADALDDIQHEDDDDYEDKVTAAQKTMLNNLLTFDDVDSYNYALKQMDGEMYTMHGTNLPNQMESFNRFISQHLTQMRNGNNRQVTRVADSSLGMSLATTDIDPETMAEIIEGKQEEEAREYALSVPDSTDSTKWSVWGQIINMWHKEKASVELTGYNNSAWGAVVGTDRKFAPGLRIGALIGYIRSEYHMNDSRGKLDVDTLRVGPYIDWSVGKLFIEGTLTFGYHWNDAERQVNYDNFSDVDTADDYGAWDVTPYARVGYRFNVAGWDLTPSMALQYVHYNQNGTNETGGAAALEVGDYTNDSFRQIFMVEISKLFDLKYVKLVPAVSLGYSYDYLNPKALDAGFVGGYPMTFYTDSTSKGHFIWGVSVTALLSDDLSLFLRYDGFAAGSDYSNALSSGVNYKF